MATIVDHQLSFEAPDLDGMVRTVARLKLKFSAREVAEDFDYRVDVRLIRRKPGTEYVTMPKGDGAMHLVSIPADPKMLISGGSVTTKPTNAQVEVEMFYLGAEVPRFTRVQSVACVSLEISDAVNFAPPQSAP